MKKILSILICASSLWSSDHDALEENVAVARQVVNNPNPFKGLFKIFTAEKKIEFDFVGKSANELRDLLWQTYATSNGDIPLYEHWLKGKQPNGHKVMIKGSGVTLSAQEKNVELGHDRVEHRWVWSLDVQNESSYHLEIFQDMYEIVKPRSVKPAASRSLS